MEKQFLTEDMIVWAIALVILGAEILQGITRADMHDVVLSLGSGLVGALALKKRSDNSNANDTTTAAGPTTP